MPMAITAETALQYMQQHPELNRRGFNVYTSTELMGVSGRDKHGEVLQSTIEQPLFQLRVDERIDMFRNSADIFGVVASRMQRIAGLEWQVVCDEKDEERQASALQDAYQIWKEYETVGPEKLDLLAIRLKMGQFVRRHLPEVLPDLSNFNSALARRRRQLRNVSEDRSSEIEEWLMTPNPGTDIYDFMKMFVFDLMVHGAAAVFKDQDTYADTVTNFYNLPGGTTIPARSKFVGGANAYFQMIDGEEPKVYFSDELSFTSYVPTTARAYGFIPLEALVNKVAEALLFDRKAAEEADGTRPPEKLIVFGDTAPFGAFDNEFDLPMPKEEQQRLETMINEARKEAIRTMSGVGTPMAVDLSRSDQFPHHMERQRQIREYVGLVFQATPIEMNLTGSDSTSGRSTSESQERIDRQRGVWPIVQMIQNFFTRDIIPYRFGTGHRFEFTPGVSEFDTVRLVKEKLQSGAFSVNEVRQEDLGKDPYQGEEYDLPQGGGQQTPGADEMNPMFTESVGGMGL
jgi:hypothetical protein